MPPLATPAGVGDAGVLATCVAAAGTVAVACRTAVAGFAAAGVVAAAIRMPSGVATAVRATLMGAARPAAGARDRKAERAGCCPNVMEVGMPKNGIKAIDATARRIEAWVEFIGHPCPEYGSSKWFVCSTQPGREEARVEHPRRLTVRRPIVSVTVTLSAIRVVAIKLNW